MRGRVLLLAGIALLGAAPATLAAGRAVPTMRAFSQPQSIAAGPDGALWFTQAARPVMGRIDVAGSMTEFRLPLAAADVTAGPDGNLWFTESSVLPPHESGRLGSIAPDGAVRTFAGLPGTDADQIAAGPDAALWFTTRRPSLGHMSTSGAVEKIDLPGLGTAGYTHLIGATAAGPVWFTGGRRRSTISRGDARAGWVSGDGAVHLVALPGESPTGLAPDPSGGAWISVVQGEAARIVHVGADGAVVGTLVPPEGYGHGGTIALGPDGNLWSAVFDAVWRITPAGRFTRFVRGLSPLVMTQDVVAGPDGAMWFTESIGDRIGRIAMSGAIGEHPPTAVLRSARLAGPGAVAVRLACPVHAPRACGGTISLKMASTTGGLQTEVGRRPIHLAAGRSGVIRIPLSRPGRARVARTGGLQGSATVTPTSVPESGATHHYLAVGRTTDGGPPVSG